MKKDNLLHLFLLFHKYINMVMFEPLTEESELTRSQLSCLRFLYLNPNSSAGEVAEGLEISCGACTRTIDRLKEKGLVRRRTSTYDRRIQKLSLTKKGREYAERSYRNILERFNALLATLTPQVRITLEEVLSFLLERGIAEFELSEEICLRCGLLHLAECPANKVQALLSEEVGS